MGVIDKHRELLPAVHGLESARDRRHRLEAGLELIRAETEGNSDTDGRQGIVDVEEPAEPHTDVELARRADSAELNATSGGMDARCADIGRVADAVFQHLALGGLSYPLAVGIVYVHHANKRLVRKSRVFAEEPQLGVKILLHRLVEIEMVLGEICEHPDIELASDCAAHVQGVR